MDFDQLLDILCYFLAALGPGLLILCFIRWLITLFLAVDLMGILLCTCMYCIAFHCSLSASADLNPIVIVLTLLIVVPLVWLNWPEHREVEEGETEECSMLENILRYTMLTVAAVGCLLALYNVYQFLVLYHWTAKQAEAEWEAGLRWE